MIIRNENEKDYKKIYPLIKKAFETAEHKDGNEQDLAEALRKGSSFVEELSLVAEIDGDIAGHIMYSKAKIGEKTVLVLAPPSVAPQYQRQGVGTKLITESMQRAKEIGWEYIFVLGSENYYPYSVSFRQKNTALRRRTEFPHRILWRSSCAKTRRCLTENLYMQKNSVSDTI